MTHLGIAFLSCSIYIIFNIWYLLQVWLQKAKSLKAGESGECSNKKRSRSEEESTDDRPSKEQKAEPKSPNKKPLAQSTNSKLAGFAFSNKS